MKCAAFLVLLLAALGQGAKTKQSDIPHGCEDVTCPTECGDFAYNLPHPFECTGFCKCVQGVAQSMTCPDGLHFNAALELCDFPQNARCLIGIEPTGCDTVECPAVNGLFALHLPDPTDCGSFCKCDWGNAIHFKCPDNLHFNPILQVCDWPSNVDCKTSVPINTTPKPETGGDITAGPNGCEFVRCPAENGESVLHLPNPTDCGSFCKCDWGQAIYFKCPDGLHFNAVLEVCDWPQNAKCDGPIVNPTEPQPTPTLPGSGSGTDVPGTPGKPTGCENVECPAQNGELALHLPNPTDCGSFCKCDWGQAIYFKCPDGLHFNAVLEVCDWPQYANCEGGPGTSQPTLPPSVEPTPAITTPPAPGTGEVTGEPNGCEYVRCPAENGELALHLPNPTDCGSFCKCDWGQAIYFKCPDGLHFNAVLEVCDWPRYANCDGSIVNPTEPQPTPTLPGSESGTDVPGTPGKPTGCENVECPAQNGELALHLPNPTDCGSFCKCDWGQAIYFKCPDGLHFNAVLEVCDWPQNAKCEGPIVNPTTKPQPTPTIPDEQGTTGKPTGCENVECPAQNGELALHLPNPTDCGSFCKCDWGQAIYFKCPDGLHFNAVLEVCDWPQYANCEGGPGTSQPTLPPSVEPTPAITTPPAPGTGIGEPNGCEYVRCPAENGELALHLPNPTDCGSFCKCDWGQAIYFKCPDGLHFNAVLEVCDWPQNAKCDGPIVNPTEPQPTPTLPGTGTGTDVPGTPGKPTGCENVECPAQNGALHLPNPTDCGSFCKCDWGSVFYFKCPDGLHFNSQLEVCDWPEAANCKTNATYL